MRQFAEVPLVEAPTPEVPAGTMRIMAEDLIRLLKRLVPFTSKTASAAALRHVWIHTVGDQLLGHAHDLASGAQANAKVWRGSRSRIGLNRASIAALATAVRDVTGLVDITAALQVKHGEPTGSLELVASEGGVEVARVDAKAPTASDERYLDQLHAELTAAHQAALSSALPTGYADLNPTAFGKFGTGPFDTVGVWLTPNGRAYIDVDPTFRGYLKAARAGHGPTARPTPTPPLPTVPTLEEAA